MFGFGYKGPLCACPAKFSPALLLPIPALELPPLPKMSELMTLGPAMPATSARASAQIKLLAGIRPPALPIPAALLGALSALAPAVVLIKKALGVNIAAPGASATLALSLKGLAALPPLPPAPALPAPLLVLNGAATTLQSIRAALGLNLLTPGILPKLQMSVNAVAALPPLPFDPAPLASMSTLLRVCAGLGIDLSSPGAVLKLAAACRAVAQLSLPALPNLSALLALLPSLQISHNIQSALKLRLNTPGINAQLKAGLAPLQQLEGLKISESALANAGAWSIWPHLTPAFGANLPAIAKLDFSPLAALPPLPSLGPLVGAASFVSAAGLGSKPGACATCVFSAA